MSFFFWGKLEKKIWSRKCFFFVFGSVFSGVKVILSFYEFSYFYKNRSFFSDLISFKSLDHKFFLHFKKCFATDPRQRSFCPELLAFLDLFEIHVFLKYLKLFSKNPITKNESIYIKGSEGHFGPLILLVFFRGNF